VLGSPWLRRSAAHPTDAGEAFFRNIETRSGFVATKWASTASRVYLGDQCMEKAPGRARPLVPTVAKRLQGA
jgi:hypothetical protein